MYKKYLPVEYNFSHFLDMFDADDIPVEIWDKVRSEIDKYTEKERFELIDKIHVVVEALLEKEGVCLIED